MTHPVTHPLPPPVTLAQSHLSDTSSDTPCFLQASYTAKGEDKLGRGGGKASGAGAGGSTQHTAENGKKRTEKEKREGDRD